MSFFNLTEFRSFRDYAKVFKIPFQTECLAILSIFEEIMFLDYLPHYDLATTTSPANLSLTAKPRRSTSNAAIHSPGVSLLQ